MTAMGKHWVFPEMLKLTEQPQVSQLSSIILLDNSHMNKKRCFFMMTLFLNNIFFLVQIHVYQEAEPTIS